MKTCLYNSARNTTVSQTTQQKEKCITTAGLCYYPALGMYIQHNNITEECNASLACCRVYRPGRAVQLLPF